jgi:hypothetical protein
LGQAALRRERLEKSESSNMRTDHEEGRLDAVEIRRGIANASKAQGLHSARMITDVTEQLRWRYSCRLFGMSSLKEGAMWHICSK